MIISLVGWVLRQVVAQAEREYHDPARIRHALAELERQLDDGLIDEEEFERQEDALLDRLEEARAWTNGIR
ncbi:gas vesicle protein GvpG [Streptomyces sp. NPDC018031]|uniref:gas vesicle protein GvpG n=1 Tax=Streptomyces sp. NPDC018031 TaxID=3365033 RepID=UPI0037915E8E